MIGVMAAFTVVFNAAPALGIVPRHALDSAPGEPGWYFGSRGAADGASAPNEHSPFGALALLRLDAIVFSKLVQALPYALSAALVHSLVTVCDLVSLEQVATQARDA